MIEKLMNNQITYKFLFNMILKAPDCPLRWKNKSLRLQPYSIYSQKDQKVKGHLEQFISDLLHLDVFNERPIDDAFDELFGDPVKT